MTIKQLHYFIAVAETRNFTHAARNCFIAQTAMSQQIHALEKDLGFRLFNRTNRTVELTEGGAKLLERVHPLVLDLEDAIQKARAEAGVENHMFRIGLSDQTVYRFLSPTLRDFAASFSRVIPILISDNPMLLLGALSEGRMDAAMLSRRDYQRPKNMLAVAELFRYPVLEYVLAVPMDSPLQEGSTISWKKLQGQQMIAYSPLRENQQGAELFAILHAHNVSADVLCSTRSVDTALLYVAAGLGCCLLPAFAGEQRNQEVKMISLESNLWDTMLLIWHKDTDNPLVGEFLNSCRRTMKNLPLPSTVEK